MPGPRSWHLTAPPADWLGLGPNISHPLTDLARTQSIKPSVPLAALVQLGAWKYPDLSEVIHRDGKSEADNDLLST
jgi:hypothetical protein